MNEEQAREKQIRINNFLEGEGVEGLVIMALPSGKGLSVSVLLKGNKNHVKSAILGVMEEDADIKELLIEVVSLTVTNDLRKRIEN